jgi:hypothetical protein
MKHTIKDEHTPPPLPNGGSLYYLRAKHEPTVLIHAYSGDTFVREDGKPWKHAGVWVNGGRDGGHVTREPTTAWADPEIYPYEPVVS